MMYFRDEDTLDRTEERSAMPEPEAIARIEIDRQLEAAGWVVQDRDRLNPFAGTGIAIREVSIPGAGEAKKEEHVDQKSWDSFVFDVIEPLHPVVDGHLLTLLERRSFGKREFFETRQGACRLLPPLPQALAELAPELGRLAAPVVKQVAQRLADGRGTATQPLTDPTLLTETSRSAGRDGVRVKPKREVTAEVTVPKACTACGVVLERQDRDHCDDCLPGERAARAVAYREAGRARREALRAVGLDPAHSTEANRRRGEKVATAQKALRQWDAVHEDAADPEVFQREILPGLQGVSLTAMAKATGLSEGYCSFVRRGIKVPHLRHWETLRLLAGAGISTKSTQ